MIPNQISSDGLAELYRISQCYVLPTRGDGWARSVAEAMSSALPVIATNWSGPATYITSDNAYPIPVERLELINRGRYEGHQWAVVDKDIVKSLMLHVYNNYEDARKKGIQARQDMISKYSIPVVSKMIKQRLDELVLENIDQFKPPKSPRPFKFKERDTKKRHKKRADDQSDQVTGSGFTSGTSDQIIF